ncbi:DUF1294 domain-containing protein [Rhizobium sp. S152]|uniref:DUF1294 domain-containing protein n=1 Tax=Rhizobium sp. S152 TaxID=3055038 RepID=UPI0025A9D2F7|nr:DUF1294 domain-containing protein [Rhizobium sp. S152]MDM9629455.1 DUF1294 domain-containing protein [Rhizobium sp. S152]
MPSTTIIKLAALFAAWNAVVFSAYFIDKQAARHGRWRISESTLLWLAFFGGTPGAVSAQRMLRHKTVKEPFRSSLRTIVVLHIVIAMLLMAWLAAALMGFGPPIAERLSKLI